jgi:DNA-binding transcriptional ArsR family regulator
MVPYMNPRHDDLLDATFAALADRTRRAILARLRGGAASIGELAEPFDLTPRAISKHVAVLEAAGLVTRERDAQRRPSRLRAEPLISVDEWLETYRPVWKGRFRRLHQQLDSAQKGRRR